MYDASSIRAENRVNYGQWMDKRGKLTRDNILVFLNKKLLLGVCFGHQLIAKALGGEVKKADIGWVLGVQSYEFKTNYPWLEHMNEDVQLIHSHQDQVMRLPESATLVASNKYVPNSMYYIEDHVMCMQGHPEFTNAYAYDVLCKRRDVLGEEKFKQAISLFENSYVFV